MNSSESYQHQKALHAAYVAQRVDVDNFALEMGGRYERMLSLVSGGSLAVSLTFIEKIAPIPKPFTQFILLGSWILLASAVIASLVAIRECQNALGKKIEILDSEITLALQPEDEKVQRVDVACNPFVESVRRFNKISFHCTAIGLLLLIAFAFFNLPTRSTYAEPKTDATTKSATCGCSSADKTGQLHPLRDPSSSSSSSQNQIDDATATHPLQQDSAKTDARVKGIIHPIPDASAAPSSSSK